MKKAGNYFARMGFKRQLILAFIATTLMTLVISIVVIKLQIASVQFHTDMDLESLNYADYQTATSLTAKTIKSGLLSYFFTLSQLLDQLSLSNKYFLSHPNSYTSNEATTPLQKTSSFTESPNYSTAAQYQYQDNSIFYPQFSYFDVLLPNLFSMTPEHIKRFNILFINPSNLSATCIRTIPATSDFSITQTDTFSDLLNSNSDEQIFVSLPYTDSYTTTDQLLMYLGTKITVNSTFVIILQL